MRTLVVLGILLVAFVAAGLYEQQYLAQTGQQMAEHMQATMSAVRKSDWSAAKEHVDELDQHWKSISRRWNLLTEHQEIDDINGTVSRLKAYVDEKNAEGTLSEAMAALQLFRHIPEKETLTLSNIL